jgi:hypothetical protein
LPLTPPVNGQHTPPIHKCLHRRDMYPTKSGTTSGVAEIVSYLLSFLARLPTLPYPFHHKWPFFSLRTIPFLSSVPVPDTPYFITPLGALTPTYLPCGFYCALLYSFLSLPLPPPLQIFTYLYLPLPTWHLYLSSTCLSHTRTFHLVHFLLSRALTRTLSYHFLLQITNMPLDIVQRQTMARVIGLEGVLHRAQLPLQLFFIQQQNLHDHLCHRRCLAVQRCQALEPLRGRCPPLLPHPLLYCGLDYQCHHIHLPLQPRTGSEIHQAH